MVLFYMTYVVPASILIPIIAAFINFRYLSPPHHSLLRYLIFSLLGNALNIFIILRNVRSINFFNWYIIFEFIFLSLYFAHFFEKRGRQIIWLMMGALLAFGLLNIFYIQKDDINTYSHSAGAVLMIVYSMLYFFKQSNNEEEHFWGAVSYNWINTGILLYYASCFFMFLFTGYLAKASYNVGLAIWAAHDTIFLIQFILFAIGFYKCKTQLKVSTF